jgi:AbrB family looped-hinge helix DNA binding protein
MSSKGQLVIPAQLRKKYKLKTGARLILDDRDGEFRIKPSPPDDILALRGKFAGLPLEADLLEERRKWDERLERL